MPFALPRRAPRGVGRTAFLRRPDPAAATRVGLIAVTLLAVSALPEASIAGPPARTESVSGLKRKLAEAMSHRNFMECTEAVDALAEIGSSAAIDALVSVGLRGEAYAVEKYVAGKLVGLPEGESLARVCHHATKHKNHKTRVVLTLVLAARTERDAFKAVLTNLYDKNDAVALTAVEAVVKKDHVGAVSHLIVALDHQEKRGRADGLVAYEIRKALLGLTGEDIVRAIDWRNFWEPRKDGFVRPDPETAKVGQVTSVWKDPSRFFGVEVAAKRVLFILDVSESMLIKDPLPEAVEENGGDQGGTGVGPTKPKKKPKPAQIPESRMRLRRVQKELIRTIEKLPEDVRFDILTFNHEIHPLEGKLVRATGRNRSKAIQFVRAFNAQGETYTDRVLQQAFAGGELQEIFLLSDGAPRRNNTLLPIDPILKWVREANRFRRVRIHAIGFAQAGKNLRKFMRSLAGQNNGQYVELQ